MENEVPVEVEVNGVGDSPAAEEDSFYDADHTAELTRKLEALEQENRKLASENEDAREKAKKMAISGEDMEAKLRSAEAQIERALEAEGVTESIAKRAATLEIETARLQHDLVQALSAAEDANTELAEVRRASSAKIEALEKKVASLEEREVDGVNKTVRAEELARDSVGEKEKQIGVLKKAVAELEIAAGKAEDRARLLEMKLNEAMNSVASSAREIFEVDDDDEDGEEGLGSELRTVVLAAGVGAAIVAGVGLICMVYSRRR